MHCLRVLGKGFFAGSENFSAFLRDFAMLSLLEKSSLRFRGRITQAESIAKSMLAKVLIQANENVHMLC